MSVGNNNLAVDLTTAFGPDNQPYLGGRQTVNTFNSTPGGSAPTAWPQCIFNGFGFANPAPTTLMGKMQAVFNAHSANHCGMQSPTPGGRHRPAAGPHQPRIVHVRSDHGRANRHDWRYGGAIQGDRRPRLRSVAI